ncbi:MAG: aspartate carbamoyltransferase catalytic subunit [Oligoflexia bacterium]|nr:aspartate carbamoyltransferase catalytic subunit [Oligoflexia bacterium]
MNLLGRSLLDIPDLRPEEVLFLIEEALKLKAFESSQKEQVLPQASGKSVALLFFEPSTRTRTSFQMAAYRLGLRVLKLEAVGSSHQKGETIFDTARNVEALSPHAMVIRHGGSGVPGQISKLLKIPVINAGDGFHAHPTQALLDAFTIRESFPQLRGLHVLIIGDIAHSRVARSNIHCLRGFGAQITVCAPPTLVPPLATEWGVRVTSRLDEELPKADVVMALRMQTERQSTFQVPSIKEYTSRFGLTDERLGKIAKHAIIMHPGPVNRGIEMTSAVLEDPRCKVLEQVHNGVLMRAVLLSEILGVPRGKNL